MQERVLMADTSALFTHLIHTRGFWKQHEQAEDNNGIYMQTNRPAYRLSFSYNFASRTVRWLGSSVVGRTCEAVGSPRPDCPHCPHRLHRPRFSIGGSAALSQYEVPLLNQLNTLISLAAPPPVTTSHSEVVVFCFKR